MKKNRKALYRIKYRQRFRGGLWEEYVSTVIGKARDGDSAMEKLRRFGLREELGGDVCTGLRIVSCEEIAEIDHA